MSLRFLLKSDAPHFSQIAWPQASSAPGRKDELWKESCFECFIQDGDGNSYLEFNGSLSGDWNLYSFTAYREGMKAVPVETENSPKLFVLNQNESMLEVEWKIARSILPKEVSKLSLTTVLKTNDGSVSYWALEHTGERPDFHLRSSFVYDSIWD